MVRRRGSHGECMVAAVPQQAWVQDLPVCLPSRLCVYESPATAPLIQATSALTPFSPVLAAAFFAVTGFALFTVVVCLKQQWRGRGVSGWLVLLAAALLLFGVGASWAVRGRLAVILAIFNGEDGQAPAPVPSSLIGAWPAVLASSHAMVILGGLTVIAMLTIGLLRRRASTVLQ